MIEILIYIEIVLKVKRHIETYKDILERYIHRHRKIDRKKDRKLGGH